MNIRTQILFNYELFLCDIDEVIIYWFMINVCNIVVIQIPNFKFPVQILTEEFKDTKGVFRTRNTKKHNDQKKSTK